MKRKPHRACASCCQNVYLSLAYSSSVTGSHHSLRVFSPGTSTAIDASGGAVFFAAGVFYYFLKEQVRTLVQKMADAFPGGVLVFDAANEKAVRLILKTWIKDAEIKDVGAYFAVSDAKTELSPWDSRLRISSCGYMLGYTDGKPLPVSVFFRFLSKVGDGMMKMQIVKIAFGDGKNA